MTKNKTAEEIINGPAAPGVEDEGEEEQDGDDEEGEDEEGFVSIEEEFGSLLGQSEEVIDRMNKSIVKLESGQGAVTRKEFVALYRTLSGDIMSLIKDFIASTAAALTSDDDEDEDAPDEEQVFDEQIQAYTIMWANVNALKALREGSKEPSAVDAMIKINQDFMAQLEQTYGQQEVLDAANQLMQKIQGANTGEATDAS